MSEFVGRVQWDGVDLESGETESGVLFLRLDDVLISRREIPKGQRMMMERLKAFGTSRPSLEEMHKISEEVQSDPSANEVAGVWYSKAIQLSASYHFEYAEHPEHEVLVGFGFAGGLGEVQREQVGCKTIFGWDWFNVKEGGRAEKIQESGLIAFERSETPCGPEITRMVFESDVSFRMSAMGSPDPRAPRWRINILKGSEIRWPSLVDGRNLSSGFLE